MTVNVENFNIGFRELHHDTYLNLKIKINEMNSRDIHHIGCITKNVYLYIKTKTIPMLYLSIRTLYEIY